MNVAAQFACQCQEGSELAVVMYHYVRDVAGTPYSHLKALGIDAFRRQVDLLCRHYEMASLESALEFLEGRFRPARPLCLLTFDDGLKDHYATVLPILSERRIQGIFFLITGCLQGHVAPVHKNHFLMASLGFDEYRRRFNAGLRQCDRPIDMDADAAAVRSVYRWDSLEVARFKYLLNFQLPAAVRDLVLSRLFAELFGDEADFAAGLYLSWDEARRMQDAGMLVGAHSHAHAALANLDDQQQRDDISTSDRLLRLHVNRQALWPFSYPYGKPDTYSDVTVDIVRDLGFACSFATETGTNQVGQDRFRIRRLDTKDVNVG